MKLSLDETWHYCLEMWKSIAKKAPRRGYSLDEPFDNIEDAKGNWLRENGFNPACIASQCFFCDYISRYGRPSCSNCPGKEIDSKFDCRDGRYCYYKFPAKFYAKLVELNEIRLKFEHARFIINRYIINPNRSETDMETIADSSSIIT